MSQDCESLIGHMLVVNPSKRYKLQQIKLHKWIKANSSSFYYLFSNNSNPSATQPSINLSSSSQNPKNMSIYYRIKKKSSSFKQKSIKAKNLNWSEQKLEKNSTGETATPKPNNKISANANATSKTNNKIVINCDCVDDSVVDEPETKNKNQNLLAPKTNEKENAALSCISLPLYSFEEYNYNKDSNIISNAESSFNINSSAPVIDQTSLAQVKTNKISSTKSTENIYKEVAGEKKEQTTKKGEDQISIRLNSCSLNDRNTQELVSKKAETKPSPNESATLAVSSASNLRYSALSKPVSNSSSLDEGVESDLSSPTSSFSTDFLSSSVNSCYSMQISSFESQLSQNSFKLASNNINMTNMLFDQSASKKSKKFFMLKKSLIKQSKLKNNFSNLTQLNRELNSLIKSSKSSINSEENKCVQLNVMNPAKKENVQVGSDDLKSRLIKENTDKFDRAIGDAAGSERTSSSQKIRQSNFIRSFKKKASNGNENDESSQVVGQKASCLAKLKRNLFRQKSVSLNSLKDDYLNGLSVSKCNQSKIGSIIDESSGRAKFGSGAIN